MGFLWRIKQTERKLLALPVNPGSPENSFGGFTDVHMNAFEPTGVILFPFGIPGILGMGAQSKIGPSIVQRVPIDMVHLHLGIGYSKNQSVKKNSPPPNRIANAPVG